MADYDIDIEEPELAMEACDEDIIITDESQAKGPGAENGVEYNKQGIITEEIIPESSHEGGAEGALPSYPGSQNGAIGSESLPGSEEQDPGGAAVENGNMDGNSVAKTTEETNEQKADLNSALPESERAIEVERTESDESLQESVEEVAQDLESKTSADDVQCNVSKAEVPSENVEADITLTNPENHLERTPKESSASPTDHNNDRSEGDQETNQNSATDTCDTSVKLHVNPNLTDDESTTNMHIPNSSQAMAAEQLPSQPVENPSKQNTDYSTSQNGTIESQERTTSNVDSDDDTLLSELDDLLHKSASHESASVGDLPNGLRREAVESGDTKKLLLEMDILKQKCKEQEVEIQR